MRDDYRGTKQCDLDARIAALKQKQRDADAEALATGRLTREDLARKNGFFSGRNLKLDLKSGRRLR